MHTDPAEPLVLSEKAPHDEVIHLPAPTVWPFVLSLGTAFMLAALVTSEVLGILGFVLFLCGAVGWFFEVFPHERHIDVPVTVKEVGVVTSRSLHQRLPTSDLHRKILPVETFHIGTGVKGGIVGGIAMILPATLFGLLKHHSLWYSANLLAAGGFVSWVGASDTFLSQFHWQGLLAAIAIHGFISLLVGLLYGAMLPMYPRYPIVTAGIVVPLLFTGITRSALGVISPILNARIDWFWFVLSQISFGLVCGFVVNLQAKVRTPQFQALPFSIRAGLHGSVPLDSTTNDTEPKDDAR
ncbi:hypothetical protein [Terriglobus sp. TAA 43]|uniref:hypothetical protein n=1 Tax=Terriglobus sp. TAA 43 TaxID=278961 RepID=UPI000692040F|nr:hypothetical protein [Terriglobus sp. TAA 43]